MPISRMNQAVPKQHWGDSEHLAIIEPRDIAVERQRFTAVAVR